MQPKQTIRGAARIDGRFPRTPALSPGRGRTDRKSTRLNSSHLVISYAVFCLKKQQTKRPPAKRLSPPATLRITHLSLGFAQTAGSPLDEDGHHRRAAHVRSTAAALQRRHIR